MKLCETFQCSKGFWDRFLSDFSGRFFFFNNLLLGDESDWDAPVLTQLSSGAFDWVSSTVFFPLILLLILLNLSFLVFASFLIGRKLVIFICPVELVDELDPGDDGALARNVERFFEQHGIMSSFDVARKYFDNSFSDVCVDDWDCGSPLFPAPKLITFETFIFFLGIWFTVPTDEDTEVVASHKTFFFFAEDRTFTSFLENAWIFPTLLIFVPRIFGPCERVCAFDICCWLDELLEGDVTLFSLSMSWAEVVVGSVKVVWRFLFAFVNWKCDKC